MTASVFDFIAPRIAYGVGAGEAFVDRVRRSSLERVLLVTDQALLDHDVVSPVTGALESSAGDVEVLARKVQEPLREDIDDAADELRDRGASPTCIVAVGGGATMDTAKVLRVLLTYGGTLADYEGIGRVPGPTSMTLVAIATTSGTGSETSYGALFTDTRNHTKQIVADDVLLPDLAVVDPTLTISVPPRTTAFSGIDALAQAIGPYLSPLRHPISDAFALRAVESLTRNLLPAYRNGGDIEARTGMAYGSLMMGLAMNAAECIGEHFFAEVVGPRYDLPHGLAVGIFLPYVLQYNIPTSADRLADLAHLSMDHPVDGVERAAGAFVSRIADLVRQTDLPTLRNVGVERDHLPELALLTSKHFGQEMGLNPRPLTEDACLRILTAAYEGAPPETVR
jgi:alcohol dehydrogenase class IV